jgi:flagellum-specific ATP synthase
MEGDDISDPIVDIVRGIVDGHIFLSRKVAESNHYPAIDVLGSISRLMSAIASPEHKQAAAKMRTIMSMYRENKDLIDVGMYQPGSNPKLDTAIEMMPRVNAFLQQRTSDSVTMEGTISQLVEMMEGVDI